MRSSSRCPSDDPRRGPADLGAILALNLASWRDVYVPLVPPEFLGAPVERFLAERWRALPDPGWLLVDIEAGGLRGFVAVQRDGGARDGVAPDGLAPPRDYVRAFHVRPDLRGQGVGRGLFTALAARLRAAGADGVWLDVADANAVARAAYRRLGRDRGRGLRRGDRGPSGGRAGGWSGGGEGEFSAAKTPPPA